MFITTKERLATGRNGVGRGGMGFGKQEMAHGAGAWRMAHGAILFTQSSRWDYRIGTERIRDLAAPC